MSSPPISMRRDGRPVDPHFHPEEHLFRRVPTWIWGDPSDESAIEAVELPDMAVGRSKFGHAEWVRFDVVNNRHFEEWAVLGIRIDDIPQEMWREGVFQFEFRPCHDPLEKDYPHKEIRVFENDQRIQLVDILPEDIHLKWRERLL